MARLTTPMLEAMRHALDAALAGGGFDGGDFTGEDPRHFHDALDWVSKELSKRKATRASVEGGG